jgi:hypothetical protein
MGTRRAWMRAGFPKPAFIADQANWSSQALNSVLPERRYAWIVDALVFL